MPNVALIKSDGMPLNMPAGNIQAILKINNPDNEHDEDSKTLIITTFQKLSIYKLMDTPEDVNEALQKALPASRRVDYEKNWISIEALAPLVPLEDEEEEKEEEEGEAPEDIEGDVEQSTKPKIVKLRKFALPEQESEGFHFIHRSLITGYEGSKIRPTPQGIPMPMPKGKGILKVTLKVGQSPQVQEFFDWAAMSEANLKILSEILSQGEGAEE